MDALILSAGVGSRIKEYTSNKPKTMLKVKGKPLLEHNIMLCKKYGITRIFINLHYLPEVIEDYFQDGSRFGVEIFYNKEEKLLNTAGALLPFSNHFSDRLIFVIYGDNYIPVNLSNILKYHKKTCSDFTILLAYRNKVKNSGVVSIKEDSKIYKFLEKPDIDDSVYKWVNAGIYLFQPKKILRFIRPNNDFGYDVFPRMINNNMKLIGYKTKKKLITIDTPSMYNQNKYV